MPEAGLVKRSGDRAHDVSHGVMSLGILVKDLLEPDNQRIGVAHAQPWSSLL